MEEIIVSNSIIENNEKNQNTPSIIEKNDQNDQDSLQSRDSIEREINEQDQIKNSEESNYEDIEESNSPFLLRQIQISKIYLDKKSNSSKNSKDEEYNDEEDCDEFLDDDNDNNCDDKEKIEISEKVTEESIAKDSALSNKENEIDLKANKIEEPFKEIKETIPQKLNLSRQTSQNSNNSVATSVNPALTPSKKGGFYEHDNRDEEEKKKDSDQLKEPSRNSSCESKNTGFPNIKPHKIEKSTSGSNEDVNSERWSHDLYENHEKSEKKPNQFKLIKHSNNYTDKKKIKEYKNLEISNYDKDSNINKPNLSNTPSLKTQNLKTKKQPKTNAISDQSFESNKELIKQELEHSNKSKGLSLSEYLEQKGEVTEDKNEKVELKPKRRPNIQPYQPHQRFLNNDVAKNNYKDKRNLIVEKEDLNTNITSDLKKRLDFSTRKPINKSNFDENLELDNDFDKNTSRRYNLKITTNMDSSTRTVQEEQIQNEISAISNNQNRQNNKNNSKKYQIRDNDSQNFIRNTYDEYYVPAEDTFENTFEKNGYFKPKKYFNYDRNKQENQLEYDDNKKELNNRYIKNDQQFDRNKSTIVQNEQSSTSHNHNDYSEYATYNNDLNQQHSNNSNNFQVKSQSFTNSNNRIRNQHINNNFAERAIKSQQELGFQRNQLNQTQPPFQNNLNNFRRKNINSQQLTNQQNFQNNNSNCPFPSDSNLRTNQFQQKNF